MSSVEFLKDQFIESRNFVNRLVAELPQDFWYAIPEDTDSNFAWQIGHLMISQNFHALACVSGKNEKIYSSISIIKYVRHFNGMGALHRSVEKDLIPTAKLKEQFDTVHKICIESFDMLNDEMLNEDIEPIPFKHPVANTKYDALSWCFKHEMWHAAEMEAIKSALAHPITWMK